MLTITSTSANDLGLPFAMRAPSYVFPQRDQRLPALPVTGDVQG